MKPPEGIDREGSTRRVRLQSGNLEAVVARHGAPAELDAVLDTGVALGLLVRRLVDGHEHDTVQLELRERLLGAHQVAEVRRVERPPEEADAAQPRIWPSPSTR